jgi:thioesterase domain-containing protein/acyl carrier protein
VPDNLSNLSATAQKELLVGLLSQKPDRVFPLSLAQQRLWFLDRLHPGNPAYNVPFGLHLQGNLNTDALELSVREMIQRHEILRTTFETDAIHPRQVVAADSMIEIPLLDLTAMPASERQAEVYRVGMEEARLPFNLATGPLLRLRLIRLAAEECLLLCIMHHIVCDGWSVEIFVRELAALYDQHSGGPSASLSDLQIQYGDYAKWQREWITGDLLADQSQYWKQKLAGAPPFLQLPTDRGRPFEQAYEGANQVIPIPKELVHNLADFSRVRRSTLFMLMLAVFKTLLHCYTGTDDILVGVPVAGRNRIELEDLVGFFVNTLVLRTDLSGDPHFSELLHRVREVSLDAFAHADLPFEKLVEDLNPPRTLSYSPVIQVMFSAVKARKLPRFGDVSASPYIFDSHKSLFDLSVEFIEDTEDRWWLRVEYDISLFDYARMTKMLNDYLRLLEAVAAQPELRLSRLTSLVKTEGEVATRNGHNPSYREGSHPHSEGRCEPRDALEHILVRVWERVLCTSGIEIRDNFFDLGGHSLLAAQLVSEVEKAVGRPIPLSALFRGSTIESFAEVIQSGAEWSPDPLVMELNAGTHGFPLFAVVQSGIDAIGYALLARHMGPEQPFYKLQAHSPFCHIVEFRIEELRTIACEYVAALQAIQPKGPYFLIGMCKGAHIAEQVVLELESQGHEVGFLAIVDTFVFESYEIGWLVRLGSFRLGRQRISKLPLLAQISHYKQAFRRRLRRMFLRETEPPDLRTRATPPMKEFQFKRFRAPVILFKRPKQPYLKAPKQPLFKLRDHELGWGLRSLSGVKTHTVNVIEHLEMLREPAIQTMAEHLKDALHGTEEGASLPPRVVEPESITTSKQSVPPGTNARLH